MVYNVVLVSTVQRSESAICMHIYSPFWTRSFKVLHFTFRSMMCFELIFVKGIKLVSRLIFWQVDVQLFKHHTSKDYLCSTVLPLLLDQRLVDSMCVYFWALYSIPLIYLSILSPILLYLDNCSFIVSLEVG